MALKKKTTNTYGPGITDEIINEAIAAIQKAIPMNPDKETLATIFSLIDLTSLNSQDNQHTALGLCQKVASYQQKYPSLPSVAALCVYPPLVEEVKKNLHVPGIQLAAVGAGFPSSQTFLAVKLAECELIAAKGADEIDIVISVGSFLDQQYEQVFQDIALIKSTIGTAHLKVILETGLLPSLASIREASFLAMEAGADFIKTSTGKVSPAATPQAVYVMCETIKDFHVKTGKKIGIKPAGGIASVEDSLLYYGIIKEVLGSEWLTPKLFRIGASRLANNLLSAIQGEEIKHF